MSYPLLEGAPPLDSPEFLEYLKAHNKVVYDDNMWLVIKNCKYHTDRRPWFTAFLKPVGNPVIDIFMLDIFFGDFEWKKKSPFDQSIKRFHIHLYRPEKRAD